MTAGQQRRADVVVVGAGNAAMCAALSARERGADVLVLEVASRAQRGGNTAYTAGAMRVAYDGLDDLLPLFPDLSQELIDKTDFGSYSAGDFLDDLASVTEYRCDPELAELVAGQSLDAVSWMHDQGIGFSPTIGRQAYEVDGRFVLWGGVAVEVNGGGPGLVDGLHRAAERQGIEVAYETRATGLLVEDGCVHGVVAQLSDGSSCEFRASAVVLGSGGFESNLEWRARYLGPGWDLAKVRGTRYNQGDGIAMARLAGAAARGHWSGCHAVGWDRNAPDYGDLSVGDGYQKHSYPFGIMVNARGRRFVDEGADFRNYTYAKYGREILAQPGQFAWQVFDRQTSHLLRDEYRIREVTRVRAGSLSELAGKLDGVDADGFLRTVEEYNAAVESDVPFDPNRKDGRTAVGMDVPRSNWANPLCEPPFEAYQVTCGVTFTFGGISVDPNGRVRDDAEVPIPGLFGCGELVGGLFYFNYPGGSGLTAGTVLGRCAGTSAAQHAASAAAAGGTD